MQIYLIINLKKKYDVIVSNPPYVRQSEKSLIKSNVLDFEPELALFVENKDSLIYYDIILKFAKNHLNKNGKIYFETNENICNQIKDLAIYCGYSNTDCRKDILGKNRFCVII